MRNLFLIVCLLIATALPAQDAKITVLEDDPVKVLKVTAAATKFDFEFTAYPSDGSVVLFSKDQESIDCYEDYPVAYAFLLTSKLEVSPGNFVATYKQVSK